MKIECWKIKKNEFKIFKTKKNRNSGSKKIKINLNIK